MPSETGKTEQPTRLRIWRGENPRTVDCLAFWKVFHKVYIPLTAGLREPFPDDARLPHDRCTRLNTLDPAAADALHDLLEAVGHRAV